MTEVPHMPSRLHCLFFVVHVEISDFFAMGCGTPFFFFGF
jgi:hypothetical protein